MISYNKLKFALVVVVAVFLSDFLLQISGRDSFIGVTSSIVINIEIFTAILLIIFVCAEIVRAVYRRKYKLLICLIVISLSVMQISRYFVYFLTNKSIDEAKNIVFSYVSGGSIKGLSVNIDDDVREAYTSYVKKNKKIDDLTLTTYAPHLRVYEFKVCPSDSHCFSIRLMVHQSKPYDMWIHG